MVVVERQPDLLQVVGAVQAAGGFAGRLHRRQQQPDQNADDRDDHEQFDQRECKSPCHAMPLLNGPRIVVG